MFDILSIDGGGIRGLIAARVLEYLAQASGTSPADVFDMMVGTSTGGIMTSGLCVPGDGESPRWSPSEVVDIFVNDGPAIFDKSAFRSIRTLGGTIEETYPSDGLTQVLKDRLGTASITESLAHLVVPCYEISTKRPFVFDSKKAVHNQELNRPLWQVAKATSVAPTYFEPFELPRRSTDDIWSLVDGGLYANNPTMIAIAHALEQGVELDKMRVLSLGTGHHPDPIDPRNAGDWGAVKWASHVIDASLDGTSDLADRQADHILPDNQYRRYQVGRHEKRSR
ncbi:MAG: patatin-like phospholipase family protein [Bradymonadaceae bacterium]